jgi:hypothetical protein
MHLDGKQKTPAASIFSLFSPSASGPLGWGCNGMIMLGPAKKAKTMNSKGKKPHAFAQATDGNDLHQKYPGPIPLF